ncbi:hypothetical protein QTP86_031635 [Hemibagrus guttatus]|nr:hypothetical protein QTP86_031635 [Hemibagrus guttatus]
MLYTELIRLWDEAVRAVENRDWDGALANLLQISDPTSRTLFVTASVHLALGQLEEAIKALDQVVAKDERLAVGFFQRAAEALGDCIWAQKHMRANAVIDYKQLGLRYRLYSWQVLYNAAAVHCRLNQWNKATEILQAALQEGGGRGGQVDLAMQNVAVIISDIPNDDFGGFEPLRLQKPGYYEPQVEDGQDSRYMYVKKPYIGRNADELTVPAGAYVYVFSEEDRDGFVTVIHDGQRGLLPHFLLETVRKKTKDKRKMESNASGIPHPPSMKPPTRPQAAAPPFPELPFLYISSTQNTPSTQDSSRALSPNAQQTMGADSVVVKVHYTYTIALSVPLETPYRELRERIAQKLGQPADLIRLRHKQHGSSVLTPLEEVGGVSSLAEVAEAGRATLWCQAEHPLANRTILYQMVALYDYTAQGPEDLEFSEGDTIDILSEVNEEWLEGHTAGNTGIFPRCFAYRDSPEKVSEVSEATPQENVK